MSQTADSSKPVTLEDLTREWFLFLTTFRRNVDSLSGDITWVRTRLNSLYGDMQTRAERDGRLGFLFQEARFPLVYFADEVLLNCGWAGEPAWANATLEAELFRTAHGGQDFFARIEKVTDNEILAVYFKCLALGFRGELFRRPVQLRELREKVYQRLRVDEIRSSRFSPHSYEHTDDRPPVLLPAAALLKIAAVVIGYMIVTWAAANHYFENQVDTLVTKAKATVADSVKKDG